jgi:hypothetical protein
VLATTALLGTSSCGGSSTLNPGAHNVSAQPSSVACDDLIDAAKASTSPPAPPQGGQVYIGSGDTFFMGSEGRRWGENVDYYDGAFQMKIGIYTLDKGPPTMSIIRTDGRANGRAEFAPTAHGLPGPLPTVLTFPSAGCWRVEAHGARGSATILARVR